MRIAPLQSSTFLFFFNDTATTEIYTLSLHDALPISISVSWRWRSSARASWRCCPIPTSTEDRKSTRLNSSHSQISYAVFCLKKKIIHILADIATQHLFIHVAIELELVDTHIRAMQPA